MLSKGTAMKTITLLFLSMAGVTGSSQAQSQFLNLNFNLAFVPGGIVATTNGNIITTDPAKALPGWTVDYSGGPQTQMWFDTTSTGATVVDLIDKNDQFFQPFEGKYAVVLQGIVPGSTASISQTGLIPAGTQSLFFEGADFGLAGPLTLTVGTQNVPYFPVGSGPNYTIYGADVSQWAGESEPLTFTAVGGAYSNWELDNLSFSTTAVPEPDAAVLIGIGGMVFTFGRARLCRALTK
jgi:hypothetical protein